MLLSAELPERANDSEPSELWTVPCTGSEGSASSCLQTQLPATECSALRGEQTLTTFKVHCSLLLHLSLPWKEGIESQKEKITMLSSNSGVEKPPFH